MTADLLLQAADWLDAIDHAVTTVAGRHCALHPTAVLLRAVAETHGHYPQCCCAEYVAAENLAHAILGDTP